MKTKVIENTTARGLGTTLPCVVRRTTDEGDAEMGSMLLPGPNTVDADLWQRVLDGYKRPGTTDVPPNKTIASWLNPELGWVVDKGQGAAKSLADSLESLNVANAKKQIGACNVSGTLERWLDGETRSTVIGAINAQLAKLGAQDDDDDDGDDDDDDDDGDD